MSELLNENNNFELKKSDEIINIKTELHLIDTNKEENFDFEEKFRAQKEEKLPIKERFKIRAEMVSSYVYQNPLTIPSNNEITKNINTTSSNTTSNNTINSINDNKLNLNNTINNNNNNNNNNDLIKNHHVEKNIILFNSQRPNTAPPPSLLTTSIDIQSQYFNNNNKSKYKSLVRTSSEPRQLSDSLDTILDRVVTNKLNSNSIQKDELNYLEYEKRLNEQIGDMTPNKTLALSPLPLPYQSTNTFSNATWHPHVYAKPPNKPTPHSIADILGWKKLSNELNDSLKTDEILEDNNSNNKTYELDENKNICRNEINILKRKYNRKDNKELTTQINHNTGMDLTDSLLEQPLNLCVEKKQLINNNNKVDNDVLENDEKFDKEQESVKINYSRKRAHEPNSSNKICDLNKSKNIETEEDSDSNSIDNQRKKKARTTFTGRQIFELEKQFEIKKYLSSNERTEMAQLLNVTETQIKIWFQNRRTKWKKQDNISNSDIAEHKAQNHCADLKTRIFSSKTKSNTKRTIKETDFNINEHSMPSLPKKHSNSSESNNCTTEKLSAKLKLQKNLTDKDKDQKQLMQHQNQQKQDEEQQLQSFTSSHHLKIIDNISLLPKNIDCETKLKTFKLTTKIHKDDNNKLLLNNKSSSDEL